MTQRRALTLGLEIAVPIAILAAWQAYTVHLDSSKFPRLSTILVAFRDMWLFSQFGTDVVPSIERIGLGLLFAVVAGIGIGIPIGLSRWARLWPITVILLHSIGNTQKVTFIAFFCFFPILLNTIDGVRAIDPTLLETARSYNIPRRERIRRLVLPAASPQIAAGMRTSVSLAVITMVLAEYFSSTNGVGYVLLISKNTFEFTPMWAAIVLIGVLGYVLNVLFLFAERRLLAWHRGWRAAQS
jgi:ABC-type nitrate/sulfonate/bicarbonate transport system permease component